MRVGHKANYLSRIVKISILDMIWWTNEIRLSTCWPISICYYAFFFSSFSSASIRGERTIRLIIFCEKAHILCGFTYPHFSTPFFYFFSYYPSSLLSFFSDVFKLDSAALNKQPEEVFDIVGKLGEGYVHRTFIFYLYYGHKASFIRYCLLSFR